MHRSARPVMGTVASLHIADVTDPRRLDEAAGAVFDELERLEQLFSTFRPTSEISRLNRGDIGLADCATEVIEVLDACTWLNHASGGAFSVEPPGRPGVVDPAGFVKGWATEHATRLLDAAGLEHWYLSVGGDIQTAGRPEAARRWRVAISHPLAAGGVATTITLPEGYAVATSGRAERGDHLWSTGHQSPGSEPASMTVVGPHLSWADAFATAAFAIGFAGVAWVDRFVGYRAIAIDADGTVLTNERREAG